MIPSLLSGPGILLGILALLLLGAAIIWVKARKMERLKRDKKNLDAMRKKKKIDEEIDDLDDDELDRRFRRWMR